MGKDINPRCHLRFAGTQLPATESLDAMRTVVEEYESRWSAFEDSANVDQKYDAALLRAAMQGSVWEEIRLQLDADMRIRRQGFKVCVCRGAIHRAWLYRSASQFYTATSICCAGNSAPSICGAHACQEACCCSCKAHQPSAKARQAAGDRSRFAIGHCRPARSYGCVRKPVNLALKRVLVLASPCGAKSSMTDLQALVAAGQQDHRVS